MRLKEISAESVDKIVNGVLPAQKEYKRRHNNIVRYVVQEICTGQRKKINPNTLAKTIMQTIYRSLLSSAAMRYGIEKGRK